MSSIEAVVETLPETFDGKLTPIAVGRYQHRDNEELLPFSNAELERAICAMQRRLGTFHLRSGSNVLVTSLLSESAQFLPFERALYSYGLIVCSADSSFLDARRVEAIMRRFEIAAVMGINDDVLDGLIDLGFDPAKVFGNAIVWARPDAYRRLRDALGSNLHLSFEIGPAMAMECVARNGAHIDGIEWEIEEENGELLLTNRLDRALEFRRYRTGYNARIERGICSCGVSDPRVL